MVQKTDDAVGIFRNDQEKKHWYLAVAVSYTHLIRIQIINNKQKRVAQ